MSKFYAVATDSFMSGWGQAKIASYYVIECDDHEQMKAAMAYLESRSEMIRVRQNKNIPRSRPGYHVHVIHILDSPAKGWLPIWYKVPDDSERGAR